MTRGPKVELHLYDTPNGRFLLDPEDFVSSSIIKGETWDPAVVEVIRKYAPGKVCIDVGAHVGFMSVQMARAGASEVWAFEPQRLLHAILLVNVTLNSPKIVALRLAIGDVISNGSFAGEQGWNSGDPDWRRHSSGSVAFESPGSGENPVAVVTLDGAIPASIASKVGLIKIDAQGADLRVMQGARSLLSLARPVVVFEFEKDLSERLHGDTWEKYLAFLDSVGYDCKDLESGGNFLATPRASKENP